jgi:hypothetical protein
MQHRVLNACAVVILFVGAASFHGSADAGNLPDDSVKVIPRVLNPVPSSARPATNNTFYEQRNPGTARGQSRTSASGNRSHDQSRLATQQRTDGASAVGDRRDSAVCASGNPKLIGVRCSTNSECNWGARCVGQPTRCANTGAPCTSNAQCMVQGVCSRDLRSVSNRSGSTRTAPGSHNRLGGRVSTTAGGGRGIPSNPGIVSR